MMYVLISRNWLFSRTARNVYFLCALLNLALLATRLGIGAAVLAARASSLPASTVLLLQILFVPEAVGSAVLFVGMTYCWLGLEGSYKKNCFGLSSSDSSCSRRRSITFLYTGDSLLEKCKRFRSQLFRTLEFLLLPGPTCGRDGIDRRHFKALHAVGKLLDLSPTLCHIIQHRQLPTTSRNLPVFTS